MRTLLPACLPSVVALAVLSGNLCAAEIGPSADDVRKAVGRSLPFLEAGGLAWMKEKACITCHQLPSMAWSFNQAKEHNLAVDAAQVAVWNEWTVDNGLKRAVYFKLTGEDSPKLVAAGLGEADVQKLAALRDKNFVFEADFRAAIEQTLAADVATKHAAALVKAAAKSGQGGGGGGTNNQFTALLLSGAPSAVKDAADVRKTLVAGLVKSQAKDGTWAAAGQFLAQQRPKEESAEIVTLWTVLALVSVPETSDLADTAIAKARDRLKAAKPGVSVESLMLRAMLAQHDDDQPLRQRLLDELLKLQHADGGWGWLKDRPTSDPFTTGQVLYGLSYLGVKADAPAIGKARQYLLKAQAADGSWPISMKTISGTTKADTKAGDAVYSYWSTGWATIGLLESLP